METFICGSNAMFHVLGDEYFLFHFVVFGLTNNHKKFTYSQYELKLNIQPVIQVSTQIFMMTGYSCSYSQNMLTCDIMAPQVCHTLPQALLSSALHPWHLVPKVPNQHIFSDDIALLLREVPPKLFEA